jgi:hypothetical protein
VRVELAIDHVGAPILMLAEAEVPSAAEDRSAGSEQRRRDAVADAARSLEDLSPAGVEQFVRRRWRGDRAISQQDIESFAKDARTQRVHDAVDALDHRIRRAVHGRNGARQVHVSIPRGIQRKALAGLDGEQVALVFRRLRDRGWSDAEIKRHAIRRLDSNDRRLHGILSGSNPQPQGKT